MKLRRSIIAAFFGLGGAVCLAQNIPQVALDTSETMFTVLASINACGFDDQLNNSDPVRREVRTEIARTVQSSVEAQQAANLLCSYYHDHIQQDPAKNLAQYVSLALLLNDPPNFLPKMPEADLPPDALGVVPFAKLAANFYDKAGLHSVWQRHREVYNQLTARYHEPVSKMLFNTEIYLKLPSAGYLGGNLRFCSSRWDLPMSRTHGTTVPTTMWWFPPAARR